LAYLFRVQEEASEDGDGRDFIREEQRHGEQSGEDPHSHFELPSRGGSGRLPLVPSETDEQQEQIHICESHEADGGRIPVGTVDRRGRIEGEEGEPQPGEADAGGLQSGVCRSSMEQVLVGHLGFVSTHDTSRLAGGMTWWKEREGGRTVTQTADGTEGRARKISEKCAIPSAL
jgi:hypothetical protein